MNRLLVFHLDFNFVVPRVDAIREMLSFVASLGYNAILWELENKVCWETCADSVDPEAMSKFEFREILEYSRGLGLEPIPLLQTIGHAEYVLMRERYAGMRELPSRHDCYCVSKAQTRTFLKALIAEYVELFGSLRYFHLGGDEAYVFGSCPVCSRRERNALYAEHITDLAGELIACKIRPGIWNDMISKSPETIERIPRDFVIWDWNYSDGLSVSADDKPFASVDVMRSRGYDVLLCSSSRSACDGFFTPTWKTHRLNVAGAAQKARDENLTGNCVTSWGIRLVPFALQKPLIELAPRIFLDPSAVPEDVMNAVASEYFGSPRANEADDLLQSFSDGRFLTAVQWNMLKDSTRPPPDFIRKRLASQAGAEAVAHYRRRIPEIFVALERAFGLFVQETGFQRLLLRGLKLERRFWELVAQTLETPTAVRPEIAEALRKLKEDVREYLATELQPMNALQNAELIFDPLIEFATLHSATPR